jgi:hypothetical protein
MIYEVLRGKMLTITGPCRAEVVGTDEVFAMTDVPYVAPPIPEPEPEPHGDEIAASTQKNKR